MWLALEISRISGPRLKTKSFLFIIPKKIVKNAVDRNRIKRLIREAVREDEFFREGGKVYKFRVRKSPGALGLKKMQDEINKLKVSV